MQLNQFIEHTLLKPTATPSDIEALCKEAMEFNFVAVCVAPCYVTLAKELLKNSNVKIASVIGFPLGFSTTATKVFEAADAVINGAEEIDMVINIGWAKNDDFLAVEKEIAAVKNKIEKKVLKVIIETCYLSDEEKKKACHAALNAGADFIKTSTGFGTAGASFEDVKLMKEIAGDKMKIKASGGIKDKETALRYIELGASRIGTSSGVNYFGGKPTKH